MVGLSASTQEGKVIQASEVETKIRAGDLAEFDNCTIVGDLNLSGQIIEGSVHFNNTNFQDSVIFESTRFDRDTYFIGCNFNGDANFWYSEFKGNTYFRSCEFNGDADFDYSFFSGYTDFWESMFNGRASFCGSVFDDANFGVSVFNNITSFYSTIFNNTAFFCLAAFKSDVDFEISRFKGDNYFENAVFNGTANFGNSVFEGDTRFLMSVFNGDTDFMNSKFNGNADFRESIFNGTANFENTEVNGNADFRYSVFNANAYFNESTFNKLINFRKSFFRKGLFLNNLDLDVIYLEWDSINNIYRDFDGKTYLSIIKSYNSRGFFSDADNCYYAFKKEQLFNREISEDPLMYILDLGAWVFYGFGKKPIYTLIWSIFFIWLFGEIWTAIGSRQSRKEIDEYSLSKKWPSGMFEAFLFSAALFLSGTKLFVDPPAIPELQGVSRSMTNKVFVIERLLGAFFSILFFLAISGTVIR